MNTLERSNERIGTDVHKRQASGWNSVSMREEEKPKLIGKGGELATRASFPSARTESEQTMSTFSKSSVMISGVISAFFVVSTVASSKPREVALCGTVAGTQSTVCWLPAALPLNRRGDEVSLWDVVQEESSLLGIDLEEYSSWLGSTSNESPNPNTGIGFGDLPSAPGTIHLDRRINQRTLAGAGGTDDHVLNHRDTPLEVSA